MTPLSVAEMTRIKEMRAPLSIDQARSVSRRRGCPQCRGALIIDHDKGEESLCLNRAFGRLLCMMCGFEAAEVKSDV